MHDNSIDYEHHRILPTGVMVAACRTVYGNGRLIFCQSKYDPWITGSWCYPSLSEAISAMNEWDGIGRPPDGWFRELHTGQRRKDGDPEQEYYRP